MGNLSSKVVASLIVLSLNGCSGHAPATAPGEPVRIDNWVQIKCISQDMNGEMNLAKHEQKFVIVPYKKLKTPGKAKSELDVDETDDLYFKRVSDMAEKIFVAKGLQKANPNDEDVLTVGLYWNTKKQKVNSADVVNFVASNNGQVALKLTKPGQIYLSGFKLKAVGADKKTTRWEVGLESLNTDTFYMNVLPPLIVASADYVGKTCDQLVEKAVWTNSPEVEALRSSK